MFCGYGKQEKQARQQDSAAFRLPQAEQCERRKQKGWSDLSCELAFYADHPEPGFQVGNIVRTEIVAVGVFKANVRERTGE